MHDKLTKIEEMAYYRKYFKSRKTWTVIIGILCPFRTGDPFHWIPQGVYEDLTDTRNEQRATGGSVDDNVSNYTNRQLFSIFNSNILSPQAYRSSLINNITNSTSGSVVNLFGQYGY